MTSKSYVSVICEYNPFHFGHKFQMEQLSNRFDGVVCILSGNIVQRGSVAVADKYLRAETAVTNGANLVLELPVPYCCSSAKDFARSGVHIAECVGSDYLAFGAEDDLDLLLNVLKTVENPDFSKNVKEKISVNENLSYPAAFKESVFESLGEESAKAIVKPNNILALEYLSSMTGTNLKPFAVKRQSELMSSSEIRGFSDGEKMLNALPEQSRRVLHTALGKGFPRTEKNLDAYFLGNLRRMCYCVDYNPNLYSVPLDLYNKLISCSLKVSTVEELINVCSDKIYTQARVRRAINSVVFGITSEKVHALPPYTCVLAADDKGREILKNAKKLDKIDIITKPVRAMESSTQTRDAFLFAKGIEDVISLSSPIPERADEGKSPFILK